jgi:hypothetical protein
MPIDGLSRHVPGTDTTLHNQSLELFLGYAWTTVSIKLQQQGGVAPRKRMRSRLERLNDRGVDIWKEYECSADHDIIMDTYCQCS